MRLWSVHPRYLDTAGLTACWREALLAQRVLTGTTTGYRNHPQLERFRPGSALAGEAAGAVGHIGEEVLPWPGDRVVAYLHAVADEAAARGHRYDRSRVARPPVHVGAEHVGAAHVGAAPVGSLEVTDGQVALEWAVLRAKLAVRSPATLERWRAVVVPDVHPLFVVVPGPVAAWEKASGVGA